MANDFKPGDEVQLKSGGPVMTIEKFINTDDGEKAVCDWFDKSEKPQSRSFPLHSLEKWEGIGV